MKSFKFRRGKIYEITWTVLGEYSVTHYVKYVGTFKFKADDGTTQHKFRSFNDWAEFSRNYSDFLPSDKNLNDNDAKVKEVSMDYVISHCKYSKSKMAK